MLPIILEDQMTRRDTMPVRIGNEAIAAAKKAAGLKGLTLSDYVTGMVLEVANHDIDEFVKARIKAQKTKPDKPARSDE